MLFFFQHDFQCFVPQVDEEVIQHQGLLYFYFLYLMLIGLKLQSTVRCRLTLVVQLYCPVGLTLVCVRLTQAATYITNQRSAVIYNEVAAAAASFRAPAANTTSGAGNISGYSSLHRTRELWA
jgi:hypothetical protein